MSDSPLSKYDFSNMDRDALRQHAEIDTKNATRRVKADVRRYVLSERNTEVIVLDTLGRVWIVPEIRDRHGKATKSTDYPLELHFGVDGCVAFATLLHPYYDSAVPMSPEENAMAQMMNALPINAGLNEPYEGDNRP